MKKSTLFPVPSLAQFIADHRAVEAIVQDKIVKTLAGHRLKTLEHMFDMHFHMKWKDEEIDSQFANTADFFSIAKVTIPSIVYHKIAFTFSFVLNTGGHTYSSQRCFFPERPTRLHAH